MTNLREAFLHETIPGTPLRLDDHGIDVRRSIVNDAKGHTIFWLALDAIQHHLIIEKVSWALSGYFSHLWMKRQ